MVSQFLWAFPQHHADLHVIVQLLLKRDFRRCPSGVPTTSTSPQILPDCHSFQAVAQLVTSRISDPRFSARSRLPSVSTLRTHFGSALFAPVSGFVPWSVSPARRTMCDSVFRWSLLILPFPSEGSPQVETLRPRGEPSISHPPR